MQNGGDKAAEYRREAAGCLELAARMRFESDRGRLKEMAQRWRKLAENVEEDSG
jgi:hypothetical protein